MSFKESMELPIDSAMIAIPSLPRYGVLCAYRSRICGAWGALADSLALFLGVSTRSSSWQLLSPLYA